MGQEVSIDVGSVYTKVAVLLPGLPRADLSLHKLYSPALQSTIYFLKYLNSDISQFQQHPIFHLLTRSNTRMLGTGSNLQTVATVINEEYNVVVDSVSTTELVVQALDRVMEEDHESLFTFSKVHWPLLPNGKGKDQIAWKESLRVTFPQKSLYPYVLVNFRSGLSVYRVDSQTTARRISGSTIGGSTFAGLMKLGTNYSTVCTALDGAKTGNNSSADISVGDIYGTDYSSIGLKKDLIACSCGKLRDSPMIQSEDFARSVAMMVALNVAQIVHLTAQAEDVDTIVVAGSALEASPIMEMMQKSMSFWSQNAVKLVFCEYGVYLAALGGLLKGLKES